MQQDKAKIKLGDVSQTLLFPLWGRAQLSKEYSSLFHDEKAIELVEKIDYDFPASDIKDILFNIARRGSQESDPGVFAALRAKQFDGKIQRLDMLPSMFSCQISQSHACNVTN